MLDFENFTETFVFNIYSRYYVQLTVLQFTNIAFHNLVNSPNSLKYISSNTKYQQVGSAFKIDISEKLAYGVLLNMRIVVEW